MNEPPPATAPPAPEPPDLLGWFVWLGTGSAIGILGFWYSAYTSFLVPADHDYRGGIVTLLALPLIIAAAIWSAEVLRRVWKHTRLGRWRIALRLAAGLLAAVLYLPIAYILLVFGFLIFHH